MSSLWWREILKKGGVCSCNRRMAARSTWYIDTGVKKAQKRRKQSKSRRTKGRSRAESKLSSKGGKAMKCSGKSNGDDEDGDDKSFDLVVVRKAPGGFVGVELDGILRPKSPGNGVVVGDYWR